MTPTEARLLIVGNVCVQWSYLEYLLGNIVPFLLKIGDEQSEILLRHSDIIRKAQFAKDLADSTNADSELTSCLIKIAKAIPELSSERNLVVHGVYFSKDGADLVIAQAYRGKYVGSPQSMGIDRMLKLGNDIAALSTQIRLPMERLGIRIH